MQGCLQTKCTLIIVEDDYFLGRMRIENFNIDRVTRSFLNNFMLYYYGAWEKETIQLSFQLF